MAKRLNPERRRELRLQLARQELAKALNPTTQTEIGVVRTATVRALFGPSNLRKAITAYGMPVYAQHKRRKPTKAGTHVNAADIDVPDMEAIPSKVLPREAIPAPLPLKRLTRPNKVVRRGRKSWSIDGYKGD